MPKGLLFTSLFTLSAIAGLLFAIIAGIAYFAGVFNWWVFLALVIVFNLAGWWFGPKLQDWMLRFFYKAELLSPEEFQKAYPELAEFLYQKAEKENIRPIHIRVIKDGNPTAFSYGSYPGNSRIAFTTGLTSFLSSEEVKAVLAHELGHVVHWDFAVMTIASIIVQLLYYIGITLMRTRSRKKNPLALIGLVSYVFYWVGYFLLLFLSRIREYYADQYSAQACQNPRALSSSLVKIAYGIMAEERKAQHNQDKKKQDSNRGKRLLQSTSSLGLVDPSQAKSLGILAEASRKDFHKLRKVFAFDVISPWAKLAEFFSTHPLTGKRVKRLDEDAQNMGKEEFVDLAEIKEKIKVDYGRLRREFLQGLGIYVLPAASILLGLILAFATGKLWWLPLLLGGSYIASAWYRFPSLPEEHKKESSVLDLMSNLYANPVRGIATKTKGEIVGKGRAGFKFSADMILKDNSGILYVDYKSFFGPLGDLFFGWRKVPRLLKRPVRARGWFFRSITGRLTLYDMKEAEMGRIRSYPRIWYYILGIFYIAIAGVILVM